MQVELEQPCPCLGQYTLFRVLPQHTVRSHVLKRWNSSKRVFKRIIGQVEADPWEYYLRLTKQGERIALFIYCAFHPRPLLCDFPTENWAGSPRQQVRSTKTGSQTDYYNLDLTKLRTFHQFMADEFGVPTETSTPLLRAVLNTVKSDPRLQTRHDPNSQLSGKPDYETGFNWQSP